MHAQQRFSALPDTGGLMVWLGTGFFQAQMKPLGWRVVRERYRPGAVYNWSDILALTQGEKPAVVVLADSSAPPVLVGMERFPCLTVFYSVDAHLQSWHPIYAQGFDVCLISLKNKIPHFSLGRIDPSCLWWSPPFAHENARPPDPLPEPEWDMLFVGTLSKVLKPARHAFLTKIADRFPGLHITTGDYKTLYPQSRLLLNEAVAGELNFRVFEALGCGGCLLTPDIGEALREFFTPGKELLAYPAYDVNALLDVASSVLSNEERRKAIAAAGLAAIDAGHRAGHRARSLDDRLRDLIASGKAEMLIKQRLALAPVVFREYLRVLYLHHAETVEWPPLRAAYLKAAMPQGRSGNMRTVTS